MPTDLPADNTQPLRPQQIEQFERDGYVLIEGLFDEEEIDLMLRVAREDRLLHEHAFEREDTQGRQSRLSLWNHPGDDLFGIVSRSRRIVDAMEQLLGGEVYHYHSKLMLKEPRTGGAWEWHQDYGYWYQNGCLLPLMASCLIALDRASRANGCLQVLKGSQQMGRVEHGRFGEQTGADPERVEAARERFEHVYCQLDPGAGLFFHGNLLHASDANTSPDSRWSLICCYNAARNDPYKESHHPRYTPLDKVPDTAVKQIGAKPSAAEKAFLDPADDRS
ncbi:MAG: phytanoyl-CoA dioxygenase family protein [Planctomycetes bacterium]|nr:phytanoyl-CoA dioxygenase family protein [Planctomycetota bacterium]